MRFITFLAMVLVVPGLLVADDFVYQKPDKVIADVLNAAPTPQVSVSPSRDYVVFMQSVRYPSIVEVAQPMLRLAGIRIDTNTNGMHLAQLFKSFIVKRVSDGSEVAFQAPVNANMSAPEWSPDGKTFAFTNTTGKGIDLWITTTATGQSHQIPGVQINGVRPFGNLNGIGGTMQWMGDSRTIIARLIPAGRGKPPVSSDIPRGPHVQESLDHAGPAPTYEDLLANPHDEDLFDYYATAQIVYIDAAAGKVTSLGKPAVYTTILPSPDQEHLLIGRLHRPYSYQLPAGDFPQDVEIVDRAGKTEYKVATLPLADRIPLAGVRTGPRAYQWLSQSDARLLWAEALDGGNPREKVPNRDRVVAITAPFKGEPVEVAKTQERFRGLQSLAGGKALVEDYDRVKRTIRTQVVDVDHASSENKVLFSRNERDAYRDPGAPVTKIALNGRREIVQSGDEILMRGQGASPDGERPFVDKVNVTTGKTQRVFQADANVYEEIEAILDDAGTRLLTRRESPTEPPNFFVREGANLRALTDFPNPAPPAAGVKKQLVTYKRKDGVPLSFTLYLPADYKPGTKLPALVWAYPYEFSDADTAGQITGHEAQSFPVLNYHQLGVLHGYALIDNAAMPIIGDPDTVNNTYIDQLTMDAEAAVDKAVAMGVADRDRIGVFGHSYGAFMTANLLAHSKLFAGAVAESGAYNRTLTPFGFQAERRTFWEANDVYTKMSPFWFADKIRTPVLLIHGEADDNTGTFPIQSERFYAAIRGNGGVVRLVMLPNEAHGYRGRETMEHVLWEELTWFDKYVKKLGTASN
jgi:dipeptidyl aminopeptidase/acylaminoacyl peptidase